MSAASISTLEILIVDDHAPTRVVIERTLRAAGAARLRTADSGGAALTLLVQQPADLVITDHQMPEMEGLELVAAIRADPRLAHARILMVSGSTEIGAEAHAAGVDAMLLKPIEAVALLRAVEAALTRH